jgi:hypothetical protein
MTRAISPATAVDRVALGVALVLVLAAALHLAIPLPADVSWLIVVNERLLDGQRLYADILETNPPMASWLYALPVAIERLTGLRAETGVVLETVGTGLFSLWLSTSILRVGGGPAISVPFTLALAVILLLPVDSFAQREHFVLFGLLPALAVAMRRYFSRKPPIWAVIVAGFGEALMLAIKPYFVVVVALMAIVTAIKHRSIRRLLAPEHLVALALLLLYGLIVLTQYPAFLTDILPAAGRLYVPLHMSAEGVLLLPGALLVYFVLIAIVVLGRRAAPSAVPLVFAAILGCFIVYALQAKGFEYHLLPAEILAVLAFFALVQQATRPIWMRLTASGVFAALVAFPAAIAALVAVTRPEPLLAPLRVYGPNVSIAVISSDIGIGNPLARELGAHLISSTPMLWRATGARALMKYATGDQIAVLKADDEAEHHSLAADLRRFAPDLVLADTGDFDQLAWARSDPETASLLAAYEVATKVSSHRTMVTVLRRKQ